MNYNCIGIDFSINSPALCIYKSKTQEYTFTSFSNTQGRDMSKKVPNAYKIHDDLSKMGAIDWFQYNRRKKHEDYTQDQFQKIEDSHTLAYAISQYLLDKCDDNIISIGIEGYSYGSKGNSFIDLIQFNSTLRNVLYEQFVLYRKADDIKIFSPSQIKGYAGKGNANKMLMWDYFVSDVKDDQELRESRFWRWCTTKEKKINKKGEEELEKPLDDIVDSYFICNMLRQYYNR